MKLSEYISKNKVNGGKCLVMGTGPSLHTLPDDTKLFKISVNDIGSFKNPDLIVVVDRFYSFTNAKRERMHYTIPFVTPVGNPEWHNVVKGDIYEYKYEGYDMKNFVPYMNDGNKVITGHTSIFIALQVAVFLGYDEIGVIGVDLTRGHSHTGETSLHPLNKLKDTVNNEFVKLNTVLKSLGVKAYNLSEESLLTALPKMKIEDFLG